MAEKVKIISIGGGWVVNNRHIPALLRSQLFEVIGVVSHDPDRAAATATRFDIPHHATRLDFDEPWQSAAEAVMIGAVPHAHYELARAALEAGRHVLTEKPMTVEPEHARELNRLAQEHSRVLAVVHNFQFSRAANRLRHDLAAGRLGRIQALYGGQICNHARNIPDWCDRLPLGLFYDESPHFYYLLRWLGGGDLRLEQAAVRPSPIEGRNTPRVVNAEYTAADGLPVYLHINFSSSLTEWHLVVVGERGTVDLDVWRDIYVFFPNDGAHTARDILRTSLAGAAGHFAGILTGGTRYLTGRHLYGNVEVVTRFYRAIHGENSLQGMDPSEGLRVIEMQHELIREARYIS